MKIVGIKATVMTTGKNQGKTGFTYYMTKDFTDYDKENSECQGCSVTQEFSYRFRKCEYRYFQFFH